ncbi:DUF1492 domain-containing protein [Lachnospiraceae bacterium EP-SM-12S-S03]|nr:DUF1492 domain-containing protein [Lachnospiraceae bacterium EP-SM-12S-S03]
MDNRIEESNMRNENDRKKQFLRGYRIKTRKIHRIEAEIDEIRSMKMYPSVNNDGMPHGSGQGDLSGYAAELREKEEKLYEEGVEQVKIYKKISHRISELENEDERDVLFYRYVKGLRFWEIAQKMDYGEDWIYKLHGRALQHLTIS